MLHAFKNILKDHHCQRRRDDVLGITSVVGAGDRSYKNGKNCIHQEPVNQDPVQLGNAESQHIVEVQQQIRLQRQLLPNALARFHIVVNHHPQITTQARHMSKTGVRLLRNVPHILWGGLHCWAQLIENVQRCGDHVGTDLFIRVVKKLDRLREQRETIAAGLIKKQWEILLVELFRNIIDRGDKGGHNIFIRKLKTVCNNLVKKPATQQIIEQCRLRRCVLYDDMCGLQKLTIDPRL
mmetsp:Transcript_72960/g.194723  ORF Transcript_72960/g.194723 Transcript_72960/m.194723 type:complete len:238 (-) Transcript_72960:332-1045(-)